MAFRRVLVLMQVDLLRSSKPSTRHKPNLVAKKRKCWQSIHTTLLLFRFLLYIFLV